MVVGIAYSVRGIHVHLTYERLFHITENHPELAGRTFDILETISHPEFVAEGKAGEYLAARKVDHQYLIVVYRELEHDGFVITSFLTSKVDQITNRKLIWPKQS